MRKRTFFGFLALLLCFGVFVACAVGSRGFTESKFMNWFNGWGYGVETLPPDDTSEDNISIVSYALTADDYAAYGISDEAIEAGVLTAKYTPLNTTNKRTGWTWKFAGNEWSQGKVLSDYVAFTAGANYAPELTYEVLQPFGDTIIVEAVSRANSALKSTTHIDYLARYSYIFDGGNFDIGYHEDLDIFSDLYTDDCYSVVPDAYSATVTLEVNSGFSDWVLEEYGDTESVLGPIKNVTGAISYEDWFLSQTNYITEERFSRYITEISPGDYFATVRVTVICYYQGEEMYTFMDIEDMYFSEEALQLMAVPPTGVSTPEHIVI